MAARLLDRTAAPGALISPPPSRVPRPSTTPDPGYAALPRFTRLAADLAAARPTPSRSRWREPVLFFFDRRRQAELEASRPATCPVEPHAELSARIAAELPGLNASVDLRQVARGVAGLRPAAESLASTCPAAKTLADLLAVPDDEMVTVLHPGLRVGFRLVVAGVANIGQFHILLADAVQDVLPGPRVPARFVAAYRDVNPTTAAGVPMVAEARFQFYLPGALYPNGALPTGFGGSEHWLWPETPLGSVSRINGERVLLIGPPAYRATWEVSRQFPALAAEVQLREVLNPFQVAERLGKLTGTVVGIAAHAEPKPTLAKAA